MLYEFTELELSQDEFFNLIFMNAPSWWKGDCGSPLSEGQKFLEGLCCQPLKEVVKAVKTKAGYEKGGDSTEIFDGLLEIVARGKDGTDEQKPWFMDHKELNPCFNIDLMPPIWVRNLSHRERKSCPDGSYYIEDGNTRSLVYALKFISGEVEATSFPAIHATSWGIAAEILGHLPEKVSELEDNGVFRYKRHFKGGVRLPIGIRADMYERL